MFQRKFRLFELFEIPIFVDISFFILMLFFVNSQESFFGGVAFALVLAFSVTLHELGHSLTARAFGYPTRDITISLLGGCASLSAMPRKAWQEFLVAAAGPLTSFALAIGGLVALAFLGEGSVFSLMWNLLTGSVGHAARGELHFFGTDASGVLYICLDSRFWLVDGLIDIAAMNLMLGLFNLLPGFPMDGGRIFRSTMRMFMSRPRATFVAMWVGRGFAILLALNGVYRIFNHHNWGFVTLMIAWMIWQEGYREYLVSLVEDENRGWSQLDFGARVSPPPYDRD